MTEQASWSLPCLVATTQASIRCFPVEKARIGLITPGDLLMTDQDWPLVTSPGVTYLSAGLMVGSATPEGLEKAIGHMERAAKELAMAGAHAIIQCGTPIGVMRGYGGDKELTARIKAASGLPAIAQATAAVDALRELGIKKVAVGTAYTEPVNQILRKFLADSGFQVLAIKGLQETDGAKIRLMPSSTTYNLANEVNAQAPGADGIFISCGAVRGLDIIDRLEKEVGKPVTSCSQAGVRAVLKLAGVWQPVKGYGRLLEMS